LVKVRVKFFSLYSDVVGEELVLEFNNSFTIGEFLKYISEKYPKLKELFEEVEPLILVNGVLRDSNYMVDSDVEIAVLPPVSGG